jgi:NADH dehydrogenase FAD-containing subunit
LVLVAFLLLFAVFAVLVSGLDYMAQFLGGESLRFRETKECRDSSNDTSPSEWVPVVVPHVVIVGGGFGGLSAVRALRGAQVRVTLIDKRNYHLFRPMLYQVATGLLSSDEIAGPLRSILSDQRNVDVLLDEVTSISPAQRIVHLQQRDLAYDFLVLATGIQYNYFGHDEWRLFAPGLDSLGDADGIRGKILLAFERAEAVASSSQSPEGSQLRKFVAS